MRLAGQAPLAEEIVLSEQRNDRLLALLGMDDDLDRAGDDVEQHIRCGALRKDRLVLAILPDCAAWAIGFQKYRRIESEFRLGRRLCGRRRFCNELFRHAFSRVKRECW